jgi:hypothetical protein
MDMREEILKTCNEFGTKHKTKMKVDCKTKNIEIVIFNGAFSMRSFMGIHKFYSPSLWLATS